MDISTKLYQETDNLQNIVKNLREMWEAMKAVNGILSIEHACQDWKIVMKILSAVRAQGADIKLCYDPCNLYLFK